MQAFILAGGFATRLWPLTEKRPKPLLPIGGKPILTRLIEKIPHRIPITVSTNAAFEDAFHSWAKSIDRPMDIIIEETRRDDEKLGALGAMAQWVQRQSIRDDVLLMTGDNLFGFPMDRFLDAYRSGTPLLAVHDIKDRERAKAFGIVTLDIDGKTVTAFQEKPIHPASTLAATGCSILPLETLSLLLAYAQKHPDNVGGIFEEFLRRNVTVEALVFSELWFDVGSFDAYLEATAALVDGSLVLGKGSTITDCTTSGSIVIGDHCHLERCTLSDVVLFDRCTVQECDLHRCVCDEDCTLRAVDLEKKMLRKGTTLERAC